jgi:flagellar motor switch protein FliN
MADETTGKMPETGAGGTPGADSAQAGADEALKAALDAISQLGDLATSASSAAPPDGQPDMSAMADAMLSGAAASAGAGAGAGLGLGVGGGAGPAVIGPAARGASGAGAATTPIAFPNFELLSNPTAARAMDLLGDVHLNVKIELGRTRMYVDDVLKLGEGSVIELDKLAGDPVDVFVNDRHVARGEVLVLNDNFCIRVNEILADSDEAARVV